MHTITIKMVDDAGVIEPYATLTLDLTGRREAVMEYANSHCEA